jgi:hypothetical protein
MAFATSPSSVNSESNFSLDSVSDIVDISDDNTKPAEDEEDVLTLRMPVFEKEGYLNSSMITIIVSLQGMLQVVVHRFTDILFYRSTTSTFVSILTFSKENRRH